MELEGGGGGREEELSFDQVQKPEESVFKLSGKEFRVSVWSSGEKTNTEHVDTFHFRGQL